MSMTGAIRPWVTEDAGPVSPKADVRVANGPAGRYSGHHQGNIDTSPERRVTARI